MLFAAPALPEAQLADPLFPAVSYTMRAIGQDEFEDVKAPDLPVKQTSEGVKK